MHPLSEPLLADAEDAARTEVIAMTDAISVARDVAVHVPSGHVQNLTRRSSVSDA